MNDIKYHEPYSVIDQKQRLEVTLLSRQSWNFHPGQSDSQPSNTALLFFVRSRGFIPSF